MNRFKCPACGGNQYTSADTAEKCIYCGNQKLEKMDELEPEENVRVGMLTKRQLEDAAECLARFHERTCIQCSCIEFDYGYMGAYGCAENAAQTALAYRNMLERLEWQSFAGEHGFIANCPMCGGAKPDVLGGGHEPDCELATLLKESEGERK